jgi:hypothetical protein
MDAAHAVATALTEPLTWTEIRERYPDQWVCLVEIGWLNETDFDFTTARVAGHGGTRREPLDQARPLRSQYGEIGHFFTGRIVAPSPHRELW